MRWGRAEWHIWGSGSEGRVGIRRPEREKLHYFDDYINYPFPTNNFSRYIRYKDYELKDHLGNVRATITDLKLKDGSRYKVDLSSANTYYPFGMLMPERNWSSEWYRYGFNGQEKDDELKGEGNSIATEFRMNDTRLGRWWSVDKLFKNASSWTPYRFGFDNPILYIDSEGAFEKNIHGNLTKSVIESMEISKLDNYQLTQVLWGVEIADVPLFFRDIHFDGRRTFLEVQNTWKELERSLKSNIDNNYGTFVGYDLHTLQDFYAHSNYIELGIEFYKKNGGNMVNFSSDDIPTYKEGIKNPEFKKFLKENNLHTGTFNLIINEFLRPPWVSLDDLGEDTHYRTNKDSDESIKGGEIIEGTNKSFHQIAKDVSKRDTKDRLEAKDEDK